MRWKNIKKLSYWRWFSILMILAVVSFIVWLLFFSYAECDSWDCFNNHLEECSRAKFVGGERMIFEYTIFRSSSDYCEVNIELLQGELDNQDSLRLEGSKMRCRLPKGVIMIPGSNIDNCNGELKEGLQGLIIEKLYTYIVQNLGRLNLDMVDVPSSLEY